MANKQISFKPLFRLLVEKDMSFADLREATNIAASTMTIIRKHGAVHVNTIVRICNALDCDIADVIELVSSTGNDS